MQFFVLMVQRSGDVKVAQYIASRLACIFIRSLICQVCLQTVQKLKTPVHAFVAGKQHFKRRLQSHCWRAMTGQVNTA